MAKKKVKSEFNSKNQREYELLKKDSNLIKLHLLYDEIENILTNRVYSTQDALNAQSLLRSSRHISIKVFNSDYAG